MQANSKPIHSGQSGIHPDLPLVVHRHLQHPFRKPYLVYNQEALELALSQWAKFDASTPLVLDSGCGVGWSTIHLARQYPQHFVLGVDCSSDRLGREKWGAGEIPPNCAWVRADVVDFWRLLLAAGKHPEFHYVLYPNPWPKTTHLQRRWHGHPVFPSLLALGGYLECRSNWQIYIEELAAALALAGQGAVTCQPYSTTSPITPFEKKYQESGHALWRCQVQLKPKPVTA